MGNARDLVIEGEKLCDVNFVEYVKWRNFFLYKKSETIKEFQSYFRHANPATDIFFSNKVDEFTKVYEELDNSLNEAYEAYYGENPYWYSDKARDICYEFEEFVRLSFKPYVALNEASAQAHMNSAHLKMALRKEYESSGNSFLVVHNLGEFLLAETLKGAQNYFADKKMEKEIDEAGAEYYNSVMSSYGETPDQCGKRIIQEIIKPKTYIAIDAVYATAFKEFIQSLENEGRLSTDRIPKENIIDPFNDFLNKALYESSEMVSLQGISSDVAFSALKKCPYNEDVYMAIINNVFSDLYLYVKECAETFGYSVNSMEPMLGIEQYTQEISDRKKRKEDLEQRLVTVLKELETLPGFRFKMKKQLMQEKININTELLHMRNYPPTIEWSFSIA